MRSWSLRTRLTVWYSGILLAVLAAFAAVILWQQGRIGLRRLDRELTELASTLANVLQDELTEMPNPPAAAVEVQRTMALSNRAMAILDSRGTALTAAWNGLRTPEGLAPLPAEARIWTDRDGASAWRVHLQPVTFGNRRFGLLVAAPLADVYRERREAQEAMLIGIPIALLFAVVGGLWLASVGLRPITHMAQRAAELAPTGLADLGQSDRRDELGQFARAFNGLLDRLRQALRTQRQFMADASHELRTPVSVIQSAAEVTLARARRDEADYRDALAIVRDEAQRLGRLVEDMLVLARADAGGYPLRRVSVYLDELLTECQRSVALLASEHGVSVIVSAPHDVAFHGDEDLLRRMIANLLRNAVQHSAPGSAVRVDLSSNGPGLAIRVRDHGPGIAPQDRARIFDRFVQLDAARRSGGSGLGLSIARWIAEVHGGTLNLEDSGEQGSTFCVLLPESDAAAIAEPRNDARPYKRA